MAGNNAKKGLGRGFQSLIPDVIIEEEYDPTAAQDRDISESRHLLIQDVYPNPNQPRSVFKKESLEDLAESIRAHGIIQPIIVVHTDGKYMIIAGERRWRAAQLAGIDSVPALVRNLDDQTRLEMAIIENVQREDLSPLEMATAFLKLREQFNLSGDEVAARVGKARSTVDNIIRLLNLPESAKRALIKGLITEQHARAILSLKGDPQKQEELLELILAHKWTAPRAEAFVTAHKQGAKTTEEAKQHTLSVTPETKKLSKTLKADVTVRQMAKGSGRLIINFKNKKDYQRLVDLLSK